MKSACPDKTRLALTPARQARAIRLLGLKLQAERKRAVSATTAGGSEAWGSGPSKGYSGTTKEARNGGGSEEEAVSGR